jgi:hypothetical protein
MSSYLRSDKNPKASYKVSTIKEKAVYIICYNDKIKSGFKYNNVTFSIASSKRNWSEQVSVVCTSAQDSKLQTHE